MADMPENMLAIRVRAARKAKKLTQIQAAEIIGVTKNHYHKMEKSGAFPVSRLYHLALALEVSLDYLTGLSDDPAGNLSEQLSEVFCDGVTYREVIGRLSALPLESRKNFLWLMRMGVEK